MGIWASSAVLAAGDPARTPIPTLAELEARSPAENRYPEFDPKFHQDVVRLVGSNTLVSGDDFFRAANLLSGPMVEYRSVRMYYELLLAAAAQNKREAGGFLPAAWDGLLRTLGRPMRFDVWGQVAGNPDRDGLELDPAPKVVRDVLLHAAEARDAARKEPDSADIQKITDADQAVRTNWDKLSDLEMREVGASDHQRNLRIREIVREGGLHTAKDFANASLVMQHSAGFAGFELAHELALCSMVLGDSGLGRWLVAATYDRMLNSVGHDQRFGTQGAITFKSHAKPELRETDEAGICDNERLALGCPTLAAKRADFYTHHPTD